MCTHDERRGAGVAPPQSERRTPGQLAPSYRIAVAALRPTMRIFTRHEWSGAEHLPASGGFLVCSNHISDTDPVALAHFLYDNGHPPYFLAKAALFKAPVVGRVIRGAGQIPVFRDGPEAVQAFAPAVEAVRQGKCVAIYPEATVSRDPGLWPMTGKTGAARVALETGCPLIPVAQWGAQALLPYHSFVPRLFPRKTMQVLAGPPVGLDDLRDRPIDVTVLREATARIIAAITGLLAQLRVGETPPQTPYDRRNIKGKAQ
jgi:1-acyl-sn-glycerol-3-phosphate acyltransferase